MPGEDEMILDAFLTLRQSHPELRLLIAPRHIERVDQVLALARDRGLKTTIRTNLEADVDLVVLDTIGELAATFQFASVVFVGGSLVEKGGHNILEPAHAAKPIVFGPHMENFRDIARLFVDGKAAMQIPNPSALAPMVDCILENPAVAKSLGENADRVLRQSTGATARVMDLVRQELQCERLS
jgi:3-deoxy-D-manno-octulosonic-acid transferase